MTYEDAVRSYLSNLNDYFERELVSGETTAELSYRPILDHFLKDIAKLYSSTADIIFEPKLLSHVGRPDWRIYDRDNLGLYGFIEAKPLERDRPINTDSHAAQIKKYLTLGHPVILTDGIEFIFFDSANRTPPLRYCLVEKPLDHEITKEDNIDYLLDNRLRDFFKEPGFRQCSEAQLIKELAVRAAQLSSCILDLSRAPMQSGVTEEENRTIEILHELQETLQLQHDPVLSNSNVFANFVAQVLTFGLLYAHRVLPEVGDPKERYREIQKFWTASVYSCYSNRLLPFKALVEILEAELAQKHASSNVVRSWYDDIRRLLAHVRLKDKQREIPDYHTLYESFLIEFDPGTRFDFGAFYTPRELAGFTVDLAKTVIETQFISRTLFEEGNKIIDPCCGTGTFIEQLILRSEHSSKTHIIGFEVLPAPYALAHYRMAMLSTAPLHDVDILLTNTLSNNLEILDNDQAAGIFSVELQRAHDLAQPPIVLVIGNPPSSDSFGPHTSGSSFSVIENLLEDFRPPIEDRTSRQNVQKQVKNDFMKFLRWAAEKVLASEIGVLALVLPSSFAAHPTYRYARQWLTEHFSYFWILDIDRDLRTGSHSSSLFDAQQGRMLLVATHTGNIPENLTDRLYYASVTDKSRAQKKLFFEAERNNEDLMTIFTRHDIGEQSKAFRPAVITYDREMYARFWAIHPASKMPRDNELCIFLRHSSGMKLSPTSLFVHPNESILLRRTREIGDRSKSYSELKARWFQGQRKPPPEAKLTAEVRSRLLDAAIDANAFRKYSFRPFVYEHILFDKEVLRLLSATAGGGTRIRPEIVSAFSRDETLGLAIAPSPIDIGVDLHRFVTFCWDLPDNDLCSRGNAHVFCNVFPEYKTPTGEWDSTPRVNINESLISAYRKVLPDISPADIVFYCYAVLCSDALLEAFADAYFTASSKDNIPRIPMVADSEVMRFLIDSGRELAELERSSVSSVEMPWVSAYIANYENAFNLIKYTVNETAGEILLYGEATEPVISLNDIPCEILRLTICGYRVVTNWLKFNSFPYTRTEFSRDAYIGFLSLLSSLSKQLQLIEEIDLIMENIISGEIELL